jgi:CRISPR-associated protein Cmr4
MYKEVKPIFFKAISGIHAGTGTDLGSVDLPIQRERHSGLPKIESSGIKGCIREEFEQLAEEKTLPGDFVTIAFGPDDDGDKHAGSIAFTDARLLLFPVRSAKGVFAYAACPYILRRLAEDFALAGIPVDAVSESDKAQTSSDKLLIKVSKADKADRAVLEEYTIEADPTEYAKKLAETIAAWLKLDEPNHLKEHLIILSDDDFRDFAQNNTEIITRTKIDNKTGTVAKGALFTEELLPAETVMYSLVMTSKIFISKELRESSDTVRAAGADEGKYLLDTIAAKLPKYIQLGGDATVGKGLCRVNVGV